MEGVKESLAFGEEDENEDDHTEDPFTDVELKDYTTVSS